jgi:hypothetical protein
MLQSVDPVSLTQNLYRLDLRTGTTLPLALSSHFLYQLCLSQKVLSQCIYEEIFRVSLFCKQNV